MERFSELLVQLCSYVPPSRSVTLCMSRDFPKLYNFFLGERRSRAVSRIMLPMQSSMDLNIPVLKSGCSPESGYNVFPTEPVYIDGFADQIVVLNSLQKPKKITLRGSDGRIYSVMCKAKDDLRLDKRLMEFNGLVNICLLRSAEARKRQLCIRTYTVVPLSEDCGLVEWVSNLEGLRHIMVKIYKERGSVMTMKELQNTAPRKSDPLSKKQKIFEDVLLKRHPAVLSFWFRSSFPDPSTWYRARLNYIRTGAVMSMVGFVLGLGDRHGENILIDSVTGEVVHVDFNCLFNKGEDLDWPELVPFRLTHNMVDAMGPLGYEGPFRRCCEVTMRVMRKQNSMLRSALETFLHDPLVEWTRNSTKPRPTAGEEKAKEHLLNIDTRLKGSIKAKLDAPYGLPLNVEGQVNHLIQQATDKKLLCQMYIGWAAYM
ncbi:unnamed protein product [Soboliphyme baturini]|uniref:Serine/threonine-protein kinase ATR n=1 Tax=Soboliphyme baturini TaxID=241478 RepID=A0A183IQM9_9BILA|nr:unnamed protein product [Soboliphyme baturini]